ncbi:MAG: hypothetical protein WCW66_05450 [Patescibacteria group bacterium]
MDDDDFIPPIEHIGNAILEAIFRLVETPDADRPVIDIEVDDHTTYLDVQLTGMGLVIADGQGVIAEAMLDDDILPSLVFIASGVPYRKSWKNPHFPNIVRIVEHVQGGNR